MTVHINDHRLYDNTRLSEYKRCPRRYYYRHVLNWVPEGKEAPALAFGSSWHAAMDTLWAMWSKGGFSVETIVDTAMSSFNEVWTEKGYPTGEEDTFGTDLQDLEPRTPMNAYQMLYNYIDARRMLLETSQLIAIERPFIVPLSSDLSTLYIGKLDKTIRFESRISIVEHKTTSNYRKASGVNPAFMDSFSPNSQVDGYMHAGKMLHGPDFKSIFIDAALVHKHVHDAFAFHSVRKQTSALDEWLDDTRYWISRIEQSTAEDNWPKNTNSCYDFNSQCPYADLCRGLHIKDIQDRAVNGPMLGFQVQEWNPVEELKINVENLDQYLTSNEKKT